MQVFASAVQFPAQRAGRHGRRRDFLSRVEPEAYFICVNASNIDKDFAWIRATPAPAVEVENVSARYAQLALQGPVAEKILQPLTAQPLAALKSFYFVFADVAAIRCMVARTGYTGEDGLRALLSQRRGARIVGCALERGAPAGFGPGGTGRARYAAAGKGLSALRPRAGRHDDAAGSGLGMGDEVCQTGFSRPRQFTPATRQGVGRKLVGLEALEPGIRAQRIWLFKGGARSARVTSGTKSPSSARPLPWLCCQRRGAASTMPSRWKFVAGRCRQK